MVKWKFGIMEKWNDEKMEKWKFELPLPTVNSKLRTQNS